MRKEIKIKTAVMYDGDKNTKKNIKILIIILNIIFYLKMVQLIPISTHLC
jgi:hypothetical protein